MRIKGIRRIPWSKLLFGARTACAQPQSWRGERSAAYVSACAVPGAVLVRLANGEQRVRLPVSSTACSSLLQTSAAVYVVAEEGARAAGGTGWGCRQDSPNAFGEVSQVSLLPAMSSITGLPLARGTPDFPTPDARERLSSQI